MYAAIYAIVYQITDSLYIVNILVARLFQIRRLTGQIIYLSFIQLWYFLLSLRRDYFITDDHVIIVEVFMY